MTSPEGKSRSTAKEFLVKLTQMEIALKSLSGAKSALIALMVVVLIVDLAAVGIAAYAVFSQNAVNRGLSQRLQKMEKTVSEAKTEVQLLSNRLNQASAAKAAVDAETIKAAQEMLNTVLGSQQKR